MKKFVCIALITFISFISIPLFSSNEDLGFTVGMDYVSKNKRRGLPAFGSIEIDGEVFPVGRAVEFSLVDGAFFPFVSYDVMDTGISIKVKGEFAESYIIDGNKTHKDASSVNFNFDYSNKFDLVTLEGGAWYFWHWDKNLSYSEIYMSLKFEDIFLTPTITYIHDYYYYYYHWKDFYIQLGISHSFDLMPDITSLTLGASSGYFNHKFRDIKGISNIDLSTKLEVKAGAVTYTAGFYYLIVPLKEFYYSSSELDWSDAANPKPVKDRNRFYAAFGAAYSF